MKVLFYSYAYPNPIHPGLGTFNRSMISGLALEHDVRVVSPVPFLEVWKSQFAGRLPSGLNSPGFNAVPNVPAEYLTYYYTPKVLRSQYGRWMDWSVRRRLHQTMKSFQPDVVLSYWAHPDGEVAVRTAHRHNVPAVVMVGGSDVLLLGRTGQRQQKILDVMHNADSVVTVSENIATTLIADGIDKKKIQTVRRGVDRALFSPGERIVARRGLGVPEETNVMICVGRLVPVKGHTHLLQSCRLMVARRVPFRCYILGDGPLREELQKQITELGLQGIVELKGGQTQSQLVEWYRAANVSVLPSLSEGVPNVLMESIACGTPFVASDVGGIPEVADTRHDRLVPPACPVALADAIEWQFNSRRDNVPVRTFEPLALRAAAQRLGKVLEDVRAQAAPHSSRWRTFPIADAKARISGASNLQNSLPVVAAAIVTESPKPNSHWDHGLCLPSANLYSEELGRTGEDFVLPRK